MKSNIAVFKGKKIRRSWDEKANKWFFSIVDIVAILSDSTIPRRYWSDLKIKLVNEGYIQLYEKIVQLKIKSSDGKFYETDCADTETMFRIIQSIPSPKAEPFKRWLSKVGYDRVQEIENPELAMNRMRSLYEKKGYPKDWIDKRTRGIAIRQSLTNKFSQCLEKQQQQNLQKTEIPKAYQP